jgi:hypothetical protein
MGGWRGAGAGQGEVGLLSPARSDPMRFPPQPSNLNRTPSIEATISPCTGSRGCSCRAAWRRSKRCSKISRCPTSAAASKSPRAPNGRACGADRSSPSSSAPSSATAAAAAAAALPPAAGLLPAAAPSAAAAAASSLRWRRAARFRCFWRRASFCSFSSWRVSVGCRGGFHQP